MNGWQDGYGPVPQEEIPKGWGERPDPNGKSQPRELALALVDRLQMDLAVMYEPQAMQVFLDSVDRARNSARQSFLAGANRVVDALPAGDKQTPATVTDALRCMEFGFAMLDAVQDIVHHRIGSLSRLGLSTKAGGHRGQRKTQAKYPARPRLALYRKSLRDFYAAGPGAKWQAAVAHVALQDPKLCNAEAVRKFLARHGVTAADFSP